MPALANTSVYHWLGFSAFVACALALDLGLFHRNSREVKVKEALSWTSVWVALSFLFAFVVAPRWIPGWRPESTTNFITGYIVELSLSMDNVFVIAVIFSYFRVPPPWQHRVLFWGILGAMFMRGLLIWAGSELIHRFHALLYVMGAFLVFTGIKMLRSAESDDAAPNPAKNPIIRLLRRWFPVSNDFEGERFITRVNHRRTLTPLAVVLVMVETTDVVFALDSIPAIFGVTTEPFLVFTSNVFAILGLRSLYFVLASAMKYFRFLKYGLSIVLVFIGLRMLFEKWAKTLLGDHLTNASLAFVVSILVLSVIASLLIAKKEESDTESSPPPTSL